MTSATAPVDVLDKKSSDSTATLPKEEEYGLPRGDAEADVVDVGPERNEPSSFSFKCRSGLVRRLSLVALAALIFGWWVSATTLHATRHRWIVQTFFAWSFIAIITFRFIPNSVVTRPVEAVWVPLVQNPFFNLPRYARYGLGWLALLTTVLGSAFGIKLENVRVMFFFICLRCSMPVAGILQSGFVYPIR
jgi:concentrative nucleoside transporter, CNT family